MALAIVVGASKRLFQQGNRLQGRFYRIARSRLPLAPHKTIFQRSHDKAISKNRICSFENFFQRNGPQGRPFSMATSNGTTNTTTLEVERKFAPTAKSMQLLTSNTGVNSFKSLLPRGFLEFEDIYYDTAKNELSNAGVWLRRRGNLWQAKVRIGGNYTNSAFKEFTEINKISSLLGTLVTGASLDASDGLGGAAMQETARFVSYRDTFLIDERFTVILDRTDFGHVIGEVELEKDVMVTSKQCEGDTEEVDGSPISRVIAEMDQEIDEFMNRYVWAFPPGKSVGKLSAYFALRK